MTARMVAILLIIFGVELLIVESFVLNIKASSYVVKELGSSRVSAKGAIQRLVVDVQGQRVSLTPPNWVRWLTLSTGVILLAYGVWGRRWK